MHCWWECKLVQPLWRTVWRFLKKKLEIELPYDPAIPLLGIHTEETRRERDTCTPMFIASITKIINHPFYLSILFITPAKIGVSTMPATISAIKFILIIVVNTAASDA